MKQRRQVRPLASEQPKGGFYPANLPANVLRVEWHLIGVRRRARCVIECHHCKTEFLTTPAAARIGRRFCSLSCVTTFHNPGQFGHRWTPEEAKSAAALGGYASGGHSRIETPYRHRHPDRVRAHRMVGNRVRKGVIVPQPCERCGSTDRLQAHHDDYAKPLSVRWLCVFCHRAHHIAEGVAS